MSRYEHDVIAWAGEQAALLRAGRFEQLEIEHLTEEVEDETGLAGFPEHCPWAVEGILTEAWLPS